MLLNGFFVVGDTSDAEDNCEAAALFLLSNPNDFVILWILTLLDVDEKCVDEKIPTWWLNDLVLYTFVDFEVMNSAGECWNFMDSKNTWLGCTAVTLKDMRSVREVWEEGYIFSRYALFDSNVCEVKMLWRCVVFIDII